MVAISQTLGGRITTHNPQTSNGEQTQKQTYKIKQTTKNTRTYVVRLCLHPREPPLESVGATSRIIHRLIILVYMSVI